MPKPDLGTQMGGRSVMTREDGRHPLAIIMVVRAWAAMLSTLNPLALIINTFGWLLRLQGMK